MYNKLMTYQHLGDHIGEMDIQSIPAYPHDKRMERATNLATPEQVLEQPEIPADGKRVGFV